MCFYLLRNYWALTRYQTPAAVMQCWNGKDSESREGCRLSCDCYSRRKDIKGLLTYIHSWNRAGLLQSSCRPPQSRFRNITAVPSWVTCIAPLCLFLHPMGKIRVYFDECVYKVLSPVLPHKYVQRKSHLKILIHLYNNSTL